MIDKVETKIRTMKHTLELLRTITPIINLIILIVVVLK
jgi:hypothetical protein